MMEETMDETLFQEYISLIESLTGMAPPVSHRSHIRRDLEKTFRLRKIEPRRFLSLAAGNDPGLRQLLLNISTINETYFFREERHFTLLCSEILPELFRRRKKVLIWSVTCSSGEEPVSMAALALEEKKRNPGTDFTVFATDINDDVLNRLSEGRFGTQSFRRDGARFHPVLKQYGTFSGEEQSGSFLLNRNLQEKIISRQANLFQDSFSFLPGKADLIFFRNTLLYMSMENRPGILERIAGTLAPGGYLFLASSEVPFVRVGTLDILERNGIYYFRGREMEKDIPGNIKRSAAGSTTEETRKAALRQNFSPVPGPAPGGYRVHPPPDEEQLIDLLSETGGETEDDNGSGAGRALRESASRIRRCIDLANRCESAPARQLLGELKAGWPNSSLLLFIEGLIARGEEKPDEASACFLKAFQLKPDFWPARFYYAMGFAETKSARAATEFRECLLHLTANGTNGTGVKRKYHFLLDGFDPAYFERICRGWIEKTEQPRRGRA